MNRSMIRWFAAVLCLSAMPQPLLAQTHAVGERHGVARHEPAAVRDAQHRAEVRYTVWYPAPPGLVERDLTIGPPESPLFVGGRAAADAPVAPGRFPTILLSHGNGGSARMMAWFGTGLARLGHMVIAVDHPGNTALDPLTVAGATLPWERAGDLGAALQAVRDDHALAPHLNMDRLATAGFSAGGFTALVAAGARVDLPRLERFCAANPADGVCLPQVETPHISARDRQEAATSPALAPFMRRAAGDHALVGVRAVFVMAPALVQALDQKALGRLQQPLRIVQGDADTVAPAATNARVLAGLVPAAVLSEHAGAGHYDFLAACTELGRQRLATLCGNAASQAATHAQAIALAHAFLSRALPASDREG